MSRDFKYRVTVDVEQIRGAARVMQKTFEEELSRIKPNVGSSGGAGTGDGGRAGGLYGALGSASGLAMGGLAAYAGIQGARLIAGQAKEMAEYSTTLRRTSVAFELLSGSSEIAADKLRAVERASGGGIDKLSAMNIANRAAALGMANTADELSRVTRFATIAGRVLGVDTTQALDNMALAASNLSFARLDQLGISSSEVRVRFAELRKEMSDNQAFLQAMLETGEKTFAGLNDGALTAASGVERLTVAWKNLYAVQTGAGSFLDQQAKNLALLLGGGVTGEDRLQIITEQIDRLNSVKMPTDEMETQLNLLNRIVDAAEKAKGKDEELRDELLKAGAQAAMPSFDGIGDDFAREIGKMIEAVLRLDATVQATGTNIVTMSRIFDGQVFTFNSGSGWTDKGPMLGPQPAPKGFGEPNVPTGFWSPEGLKDALAGGLVERKANDKKAAEEATKAWKTAAADTASAWKGAINGIPGLPGNGASPVTQEQMDAARAGVPQRFADDFVRLLEDQVLNGVPRGIDEALVKQMAGFNADVPWDVALPKFKKDYYSGALFDTELGKANMGMLVNKDAADAELAYQDQAKRGLENVSRFLGEGVAQMDYTPIGTGIATGITDTFSSGDVDFAGPLTTAIDGQLNETSQVTKLKDLGKMTASSVFLGFSGAVEEQPWADAIAAGVKADIMAWLEAHMGGAQ